MAFGYAFNTTADFSRFHVGLESSAKGGLYHVVYDNLLQTGAAGKFTTFQLENGKLLANVTVDDETPPKIYTIVFGGDQLEALQLGAGTSLPNGYSYAIAVSQGEA